jgi:nucleotide-binding universal stress UspA family protein
MAILSAVDGGNNSQRVVDVGYDLATTYGEDLHVIHVMKRSEFESRADESPDYFLDDGTDDARQVATEFIENVEQTTVDIHAEGRIGSPAEEILEFADEIDARYLVTGGRRKSPVGKAMFGSDAQQILLNSTIPVVTVMGPTNAPE